MMANPVRLSEKEIDYLTELLDLFNRDKIIYDYNLSTPEKSEIFTLFQEIEEYLEGLKNDD